MGLGHYILVCQAIGLTGALATRAGLREWYPRLRKPWFTPPNWVFGPVWTLLYLLMAVAGYRVAPDSGCSLLFALQLTLNGSWSWVFFYFRRPGLALINIVLLWAVLALCCHRFAQLDPWAGRLLWPYWAWVSFATMLNFEFWRLNRQREDTHV